MICKSLDILSLCLFFWPKVYFNLSQFKKGELYGEQSQHCFSQWHFADPRALDKICPPCIGKQNTAPYSYISLNNHDKSSLLQWHEQLFLTALLFKVLFFNLGLPILQGLTSVYSKLLLSLLLSFYPWR